MPRKKRWNNPDMIGFNTETYLKVEIQKDMKEDGFSDFTEYFNTIIIKILGDDNPAVRQFREEHPEFK